MIKVYCDSGLRFYTVPITGRNLFADFVGYNINLIKTLLSNYCNNIIAIIIWMQMIAPLIGLPGL
jgi:hypothetical protein